MNDKGLPDQSLYMQWIDEKFPEKYKNLTRAHIEECFQKYGKNKHTCNLNPVENGRK